MKPASPSLRCLLFLSLLAFLWPAGRADGQTVVAWGSNYYGQSSVPAGLTDAIAVAAGGSHSLALRADGSVVAWGHNGFGQCTVPEGLTDVIAVAAGGEHSLALKADGSVVAWGNNADGQSAVPAGLTNVIAVAAGGYHSLALKADGSIVAWGDNEYGQGTVPPGLANVISVATGRYHSMALKADGTAIPMGDIGVPAGLDNVISMALGEYFLLALKADGSVFEWGDNFSNQIAVPEELARVIAVTASDEHSLALNADGSVVAWGKNNHGQSTVPEGLANVVAIAAGGDHSLTLVGSTTAAFSLTSPPRALAAADSSFHYQIRTTRLPGTPLSVTNLPAGLIFDAATGVISGTPTVAGTFTVEIAPAEGGSQASLRLTILGSPEIGHVAPVVVFPVHVSVGLQLCAGGAPAGFSAIGLPPGISIETATGRILGRPTTPGEYAVTVTATNRFGSDSISFRMEVRLVAAWGGGQSDLPAGLADVIAVACGDIHSLALKADGSVVAWGNNKDGQSTVPEGLTNVIAVGAGSVHSLALKADGSVVAWGDNGEGQSTVPAGLADVIAVAGGDSHSLALKADGSVVAWGYNYYGQSTVPAGLANVIAVAASGYHSLALKADGSVVAWGSNLYGQSTVPAGLSDVIAVAAGFGHSLALKEDGSVVRWGGLSRGVEAGPNGVIAIAAGTNHSLLLKEDGSVIVWHLHFGSQNTGPAGLADVTAVAAGFDHSLALTKKFAVPPIAHFPAVGQPLSIPGPGAKAGCTYRVTGLPAWLTLEPLTGTLSGTAPASVEAITLTRELRYRAGYTVEEQVLGILPAWYSSYAAWQTHHFGTDATLQSQPAVDADGDGLPNLIEFLTGTDPGAADSALRLQQEGSAFAVSLDVLPGMETAATLRAQFSNDLTFTVSAEVPVPSRRQTLPSGLRRLVFEDPAPVTAARRFARLVVSMP